MQTYLKTLFIICASIICALIITSCETQLPEGEWSKEPQPTITYQMSLNKTMIVAKAQGSSETFSITSDDSWTISTSESWIKVSDTTGAGDKSVTVTVEANTGKEARSGSITVKGKSSGTKSISVSQLGKEYSLTVDKTEISVGAAETSETISITSNDDWTVSASEAWVKVSETTGNGDKAITVTVEVNTGKEARTATITIAGKNSEDNQTITVSQEGKLFTLSLDKTAITAGFSGSTETITITSNDSWTASSDASWITLSATSGSGDSTLDVSISLNSTTTERTGIVTVKGTNSGTKTITISQEGKSFTLNVDKTSISVGAEANNATFRITGDDTWTASSDASWATLSATSGNGDKTITVSVSANSSTTARTAQITVNGTTSGVTKTITISQDGVAYTLSVSRSSISTDSAEGSESFNITSNDSWTVSSDAAWITLSSTSGSGDKTITVSFSMNSTTSARSGKITVKGTNGGATKTITVSQAGQDITYTTSVSKTSISVGADTSSDSFKITSNESWTATSDASWATLSATSGNGDKTITVSVSANNSTSARSGKITVKGTNSGTTKTITVSQEGKEITYATSVSKTSIAVGASSASETFSITSNESWTASSDASWATLSATSGSGDKTITVSFSMNSTTSDRSGKITVKGSNSGTTKTITVSQEGRKASGGNGTNGHEYVDLGLPSGLLWATCNVGASKPEDYGDYFAWGETETKSTYNWSTYKYCKGSSNTLTKYNNDSRYGIVDNKDVLDLDDDAAHVNWGGSWRMPTKAELNELRDSNNCTWTWTTQNGVNGYKVTSKKNGNSLFLPAAGYRDISSLDYAGSRGYYWSPSLSTSYPFEASYLYFYASDVGWSSSGRSFRDGGRSVRPVCASSE